MSAAQNPLNVCPYWVGDVLVTMSEISPQQRWPWTSWEQITDCMLRAADLTHPAGSTGGAWEVVQTEEQVAEHNHYYASFQLGYPANYADADRFITPVGTIPYSRRKDPRTGSSYAGKNQPMSIVNKYIACYMWKRTG
ncbi:MAG: hypothetical protein SPH66_02780 [Gemmiger sp.]|uniref:hypothetical protein n=1 Tax=Gemmiger sp. TaxID=2049027 RepID=UPI002A919693|nr:hypothetical protein [Gemmiger sp.]MDY5202882.1 hypothetical protein [Gemmiger sp.]